MARAQLWPAIVIVTLAMSSPAAAQRLQMQYLYDQAKSSLEIADIQFPSVQRGIAVGEVVSTTTAKSKPVALLTSDGGAHWQVSSLPETPVSLFFLNENAGWLVGEKNIWKTSEAGRNWTRLAKMPQPTLRVYFVTETKGFAVCANKTFLRTDDGGAHWKSQTASPETPGNAQTTRYNWIDFGSAKDGIVVGASNPPRRPRFPDWMEPDNVVAQRETPHVTLTLETHDGGESWKSAAVSMFGQVTRIRSGTPGWSLALIEHLPQFQYPSEVLLLNRQGGNSVVFREKDFFVTDLWVSHEGACYLAGLSLASRLHSIVPQKVKVLRSNDLKQWTPVAVDYRAIANRVFLAGSGADSLWLATNNGTILKLGF